MIGSSELTNILTLVGYGIGYGFGIGLVVWLIAWGVSAVSKVFRNVANG